jgi:hypothetical protein
MIMFTRSALAAILLTILIGGLAVAGFWTPSVLLNSGVMGPAPNSAPAQATSATAADRFAQVTKAQWREDLQFLARELPKRHASAFHHTPRERFEAAVADLDRRIDHLNADEIYVGLDRIANLVGDAHTFVEFPDDPARLPLSIKQFGEDYRVWAVAPGWEPALGARVLRIQGTPIARVRDQLLTMTPQDETPFLAQARVENLLTLGIVLHGYGLSSDRRVATFALADEQGREFTVEARALAPGAKPAWMTVFRKPPLYRERPGETFWYTYLPEARTVYCNFRGYNGLGKHSAALFKLVDEQHPTKFVIDMRQNGGGDYTVGLRYLVRPIRERPELNTKGHLYILIGPQTFSAAMSNAAHFRAQTAALLVGEPIGEKPNSYQESRRVKLPNSGLMLFYSVRFYKFVEAGENLIRPDQEIIPSWSEFKAGRDPVLEWVLKQ